jgi:exosortase/archaeosortase family protein
VAKKTAHHESALSLRESEKQFLAKFFAIFFALFLLLKAMDVAPVVSSAFELVKTGVAATEQALLQGTGFSVSRQGDTLFHGAQAFQIVMECTGLVLVALLVALLYSTNVKKQRKHRALLIYTPFLLVFNVARLYATLWTGITIGIPAMDIVHPALWIVDSLLVLFLWARAAEIRL